MKARINQDKCIGCGNCVYKTENNIFDFNDEGLANYILKGDVEKEDIDLVKECIEECPTEAIEEVKECIEECPTEAIEEVKDN